MKTWNVCYHNWLILAMPLEGGWAIKCLPPARHKTSTNWQAYRTIEEGMASAKEYIDRAIALYVLADTLLELCETGRIQENECQGLLLSLGYC